VATLTNDLTLALGVLAVLCLLFDIHQRDKRVEAEKRLYREHQRHLLKPATFNGTQKEPTELLWPDKSWVDEAKRQIQREGFHQVPPIGAHGRNGVSRNMQNGC